MDMVHADVGREPPQDGRKVVMRAAVERRLVQAQGLVWGPESVLELVLNVEKPYPDRGREQLDFLRQPIALQLLQASKPERPVEVGTDLTSLLVGDPAHPLWR